MVDPGEWPGEYLQDQAASARCRTAWITDALVDPLIGLTSKINAKADRRVDERESEGVRPSAMDMSVGVRVPPQMARPFRRRPVVRRQSLPLNRSSRQARSLAASHGATDVTWKS
ncbi:hypothetical protein [Streptosporangium pseudovulgare]|uniref:Uncharacterized protein n=1 Tax=Streptosporangium pseudovulgare TaxID=35765 RepID=A0ABQ2RJE7_9ACTN|nr:hypothetical protein [Streptosporangium pseudovulgare]GGQ32081.1 hypothetical protein GCM10010140_72720 [Streptosporangium pseudovulgare]